MTTISAPAESYSLLIEERVGSPSTAPVSRFDRISSIDVLRGLALLGILVVNIDDFGNPQPVWPLPIGTPIDNFYGPHAHLNLFVLLIKWMFFEGKMRSIFSMLFGAGVILLTSRAELKGNTNVADIYTRRNLLLMFFGILHFCLIWTGDILLVLGLQALLFLYPCRRLKAKTLLWIGALLSLLAPILTFNLPQAVRDLSLSHQAAKISIQENAGVETSPEQRDVLRQWKHRVDSHRITPELVEKSVRKATQGYWKSVKDNSTRIYLTAFPQLDELSAMFIGMGLMKIGFFTVELSYGTYIWMTMLGFAISIPLYATALSKIYASGFFFLTCKIWFYAPYYIMRESGALAIAAVTMLIIKSGALQRPQHLLAAVGRTAFSNYIFTSILCQTIFLWGPWKLFGKLEYYQLMYVVLGVWIVNLVVSSLWLKKCAFGPLEWVWRSLTYGTPQPMLLKTKR